MSAQQNRWFTLEMDDDLARTMTRAQYYAARSWLRLCAREIHTRLQKEAP